ncbi:hypothetical protein K3495_g12932 [Podosphaera aphanis]|nr:hypothetical protein K3495_g12932 [Podosphaera aphanis]
MRSSYPQVFTNENEVFDWLEKLFRDPNERETARAQYNRCRMSPNETFGNFYSRFSAFACKARISQEDQLKDMFRKFDPDLHQQAIHFMSNEPDYSTALKRFHVFDNELRLNRASRARRWQPTAFTTQSSLPIKTGHQLLAQRGSNSFLNPSTAATTALTSFGIGTDINNRKRYNCRKFGHTSHDCPQPQKPITTLSPLQQIEEENNILDSMTEECKVDEADSYDESENEKP